MVMYKIELELLSSILNINKIFCLVKKRNIVAQNRVGPAAHL